MSKQIKLTSDPSKYPPISSQGHKIKPLKHQFVEFQSNYDYSSNYKPKIFYIHVKNPKWCHLSLKLGHTGEFKKFSSLCRAKSLRLRSVHLESYSLDSQGCGDQINPYFGELDVFNRAGQTLKKLSLSVIHNRAFMEKYGKPEACKGLKRFVKKQKCLDEFGLYLGERGDSKWMANLLVFMERTVKTLSIQNLTIEDLFKKYEFPKLETLRFEYMWFYGSEELFDFTVMRRALDGIMALPSLKALTFSQYQRYEFETDIDAERRETSKRLREMVAKMNAEGQNVIFAGDNGEDLDEELPGKPREKMELLADFWEELRTKLDQNKGKSLKVKYHKKDDSDIEEKVERFQKIFGELPEGQTFEYEIARVEKKSKKEVEERGLEVEFWYWGFRNFNHYWTGVRYLISLDKVEDIEEYSWRDYCLS